MSSCAKLPLPDAEAIALSDVLAARIRAEIERSGGWIRFDRYMELALYEPGLGYYDNTGAKFGAEGDFVTAAELGEWLPAALAVTFARTLEHLGANVILELGAGSGKMAAAILERLDALGCGALKYLILEPSAALCARQRRHLEKFGSRVEWLGALPEEPFDGLVFANEVVDALPVARFRKHSGTTRPVGVAVEGGGFRWLLGDYDRELAAAVASLESKLGRTLPDGYTSETCLSLGAWVAELGRSLRRGGILIIDYGLVRREYYHAERDAGTLICHYRHRAQTDPFCYPGLQDISAWVDFSLCADCGEGAGLEVDGFTTQAQFLLETMTHDASLGMHGHSLLQTGALKTLILPGEMGEKFKLLWLTKSYGDDPLPGRDFRDRL